MTAICPSKCLVLSRQLSLSGQSLRFVKCTCPADCRCPATCDCPASCPNELMLSATSKCMPWLLSVAITPGLPGAPLPPVAPLASCLCPASCALSLQLVFLPRVLPFSGLLLLSRQLHLSHQLSLSCQLCLCRQLHSQNTCHLQLNSMATLASVDWYKSLRTAGPTARYNSKTVATELMSMDIDRSTLVKKY